MKPEQAGRVILPVELISGSSEHDHRQNYSSATYGKYPQLNLITKSVAAFIRNMIVAFCLIGQNSN